VRDPAQALLDHTTAGRRGGRDRPPRAPSWLVDASEIAARGLVLALAVVAAALALARLRVVVIPGLVAMLAATVLEPPAAWLRRHRWPRAVATWLVVLAPLALAVAGIRLATPAVAAEFSDLGPTVSAAADDLERWAVEGPLGLTPDQIERGRDALGEQLSRVAAGGGVLSGAVVLGEVIAGALLALMLTFFLVKDGPAMQRWALLHVPPRHHDLVRDAAGAAWRALGGYVRGATLIGALEAVLLGGTLALVGGGLVVPVAVLTFVGAYVPLVGAVVAGVVNVAVALATAGPGAAVVVAVVAVLVQQFDNDLLAPFVYGRTISLHPTVVLVAIAVGGGLGGVAGAFVAIPVAAAVVAVSGVVWRRRHPEPLPRVEGFEEGLDDTSEDGAADSGRHPEPGRLLRRDPTG